MLLFGSNLKGIYIWLYKVYCKNKNNNYLKIWIIVLLNNIKIKVVNYKLINFLRKVFILNDD